MTVQITTRGATFQQWQSLLTNRTKRHRAGEFLVQGVRSITQAVDQGWTISALLHDGRPNPSVWAKELLASVAAARFTVAPELMAELGEKSDGPPELIAVAQIRDDDFDRLLAAPLGGRGDRSPGAAPLGGRGDRSPGAAPRGRRDLLVVVFDRSASPGNIGTLIRSVDAFGGSGLIVTGHAADPYDPRCIRASTGSFFAVPVIRAPSHKEVLAWLAGLRPGGLRVTVFGTDEGGTADVRAVDLRVPSVLVIGNETTGLTAAWREACDVVLRIPMAGTASSLNAATAGSIVLYEAMRQRSG